MNSGKETTPKPYEFHAATIVQRLLATISGERRVEAPVIHRGYSSTYGEDLEATYQQEGFIWWKNLLEDATDQGLRDEARKILGDKIEGLVKSFKENSKYSDNASVTYKNGCDEKTFLKKEIKFGIVLLDLFRIFQMQFRIYHDSEGKKQIVIKTRNPFKVKQIELSLSLSFVDFKLFKDPIGWKTVALIDVDDPNVDAKLDKALCDYLGWIVTLITTNQIDALKL